MSELRVLVHSLQTAQEIHPGADHAGDIKLTWKSGDPESIRLAREAFRRAKAKGFRAYRMSHGARTGDPIADFDESAEQLLMIAPIVGGAPTGAVSACEVICDMADLLQENEWIQKREKSTVKGKPAYCIWGAYKEVARRRHLQGSEASLMDEMVVLHLAAAIRPGATTTDTNVVMSFNDAPGRMKAQVLDVLRRAGTCPTS